MMGWSFSFARVYDRVFEVLLVAGVVTAWRRLDLGSATGIGFRRHAWARELARGLAIGLAGLAVGIAVAALFGGLVPALRFSPAKTLRKALLGSRAAPRARRWSDSRCLASCSRSRVCGAGRSGYRSAFMPHSSPPSAWGGSSSRSGRRPGGWSAPGGRRWLAA